MIDGSTLWNPDHTKDMVELALGNRSFLTYPNLPSSLFDVLQSAVASCPNKIAIVDDSQCCYTYLELLQHINNFSTYLARQMNVTKKTHVALLLYNSIEFCVSYLSLNKLGAIAVPLPTKFKQQEILSLLCKADAEIIICDDAFKDWFSEIEGPSFKIISTNPSESYGFSHLEEILVPPVKANRELTDEALILFTSGTTSMSKGVLLKNYQIMHAIITYQRLLQITEEDKTLIPIPIYHITGLVALLGLFLYVKGTIYLHKTFDAERVLSDIQNYQITFLHGSPTVFSLLLEKSAQFSQLLSLRAVACGSSHMPIEKLIRFHAWLPQVTFHTVYGLTETTSPASIFPDDASTSPYRGSSGLPIPGTLFKIIDEDQREVPTGVIGEVVIKGTVVLETYYDIKSEALDELGWLRTGDIGYFNEKGYLFIVDRKKDMINCGGEKVCSIDVEEALYAIDGILEASVVGLPDKLYGEVPVTLVRLHQDSHLTEEVILITLKRKLAGYKVPRKILFGSEIPKTPNQKVDKNAIRKLFKTEENS